MTQEEKQLLFKDICARLPYGVKYQTYLGDIFTLKDITLSKKTTQYYIDDNAFSLSQIKPYLRPMSSMTEEEAMEVARIRGLKDILSVSLKENYIFVELDDGVFGSELYTIWFNEMVTSIEMLDWLNSHHFDYRGLIEKGLALEAPENMYNIK